MAHEHRTPRLLGIEIEVRALLAEFEEPFPRVGNAFDGDTATLGSGGGKLLEYPPSFCCAVV